MKNKNNEGGFVIILLMLAVGFFIIVGVGMIPYFITYLILSNKYPDNEEQNERIAGFVTFVVMSLVCLPLLLLL